MAEEVSLGLGFSGGSGGGSSGGAIVTSFVTAKEAKSYHDTHPQQIAQPLHMQHPPPPIIPYPSTIIQNQQPTFQPPPGMPPPCYNQETLSSLLPPSKNEEQHQQKNDDDQLEKARAIAMRFHKESVTNKIHDDASIPTNINYAQQREKHFQKEQQKLQRFKLRNLEFVMKQEEKEQQQLVACMNSITSYEEKQQIQLQLQQERQRQRQLQIEQKKQQKKQIGMLNDSSCGIGTKEQRHAETVRKRQHLDHGNGSSNNSKKKTSCNSSLRTSIYLTGLPTDGSITERTLQSTFCAYGRLDRITMYRHRDTGELKGDGIIVYGRDAAEEYQAKMKYSNASCEGSTIDLVETVCSQVREMMVISQHYEYLYDMVIYVLLTVPFH